MGKSQEQLTYWAHLLSESGLIKLFTDTHLEFNACILAGQDATDPQRRLLKLHNEIERRGLVNMAPPLDPDEPLATIMTARRTPFRNPKMILVSTPS